LHTYSGDGILLRSYLSNDAWDLEVNVAPSQQQVLEFGAIWTREDATLRGQSSLQLFYEGRAEHVG
jgi:hypothetical protein